MEETGSKTKKHGNGIGGHLNNTARALTAVSTLGLSNSGLEEVQGERKDQGNHAESMPLSELRP